MHKSGAKTQTQVQTKNRGWDRHVQDDLSLRWLACLR